MKKVILIYALTDLTVSVAVRHFWMPDVEMTTALMAYLCKVVIMAVVIGAVGFYQARKFNSSLTARDGDFDEAMESIEEHDRSTSKSDAPSDDDGFFF